MEEKESKLESIAEPYRTSLIQLISRCDKAGIEYELDTPFDKDTYPLSLYLPSGRDKRRVYTFNLKEAQRLNQVEFEKYVFIQGYESICSYEYGSIEAYIKLFGRMRPWIIFRRLLNISHDEIRKMKKEDLVFEVKQQTYNKTPIIITINQPTNTMLALAGRELDEGSGLTIKIRGLKISNQQEATTTLQKLANSLFFQILNAIGIPIMLEPYREPGIFPRLPLVKRRANESLVVFPKYQYDIDPLNLYWCATSAFEMPLLQFLAYYQVLEFYFPIYSRQEAQIEVANILKDPGFNPDHHLDIGKVISAVVSKTTRGFGDERAQLRATIRGCIQDKEVHELMDSNTIKEHFKADFKKLSPLKVSIDNKDFDLREQLADRLYDIRCKIVHTKAEEAEKGRILPFTKEESLLTVEVDIIEFIARKALIAGSKKLVI